MKFSKMHGIGNDFIIVDDMDEIIDFDNQFFLKVIHEICDRHTGIGADGVIFMCKSETADIKMRIFNSDGSEARMCGNGVRCLAGLYLDRINKDCVDQNYEVKIDTLSGVMNVCLSSVGITRIGEVNMGTAVFTKESIPILIDLPYKQKVSFDEEVFTINCVSMGNPHTVLFEKDHSFLNIDNDMEFERIGRKIECDNIFPDRTNVELVRITDDCNVVVRVWERGAGETLGCGTGACAVAAILNKRYDWRSIAVKMPGGDLAVTILKSGKILLKGEIKMVFQGDCETLDLIKK
ncbi:diaminopimelate epimerase [bacterium]|nr:diaminopimelate epimerase [bacterium]